MTDFRIDAHPIIINTEIPKIPFYWNNKRILARDGEVISSALIANGINVFNHHVKDHSPQGIFCANGQCSQCLVIANGIPVKACMTPVLPEMKITAIEGLPFLPDALNDNSIIEKCTPVIETEVLIIGGGPSGLSAANELGTIGINVLLIDDKPKLGGKLVLQTHRFFGSSNTVFAGTRGIEIANILDEKVRSLRTVEIWLQSTAVGVFEDGSVGVFRTNKEYVLVKPAVLLVATGAREKSLTFPGNTLPGVYGAGAFQTLVNRDLVRPCNNLFIAGGGNVGLITGYHAIQAGIHVAGLVEAAPSCSGYKVHKDKLLRSGVPIFTSHIVLQACGKEMLEKVIIAEVDKEYQTIKGTEKQIDCDTLLIAVGLDPVNEFIRKAKEVGLPTYAAGDANEIAEASAAIFSGKIVGNQIANQFNDGKKEIPPQWFAFEEILKSKPGQTFKEKECKELKGVFPVFHCSQEIPCDPCANVCSKNLIYVDKQDIRKLPEFKGSVNDCIGCFKCLAVCPGLAISLVDYRVGADSALVSLPFEMETQDLYPGTEIEVTDTEGNFLSRLPIHSVKKISRFSGTSIVTINSPKKISTKIAGIRLIKPSIFEEFEQDIEFPENFSDEAYVCRCERVTVGEIRQLIKEGVRDINQIKALTKASMGACGGKTCLNIIKKLYLAEGISLSAVTEPPIRPAFVEIPLGVLAGRCKSLQGEKNESI